MSLVRAIAHLVEQGLKSDSITSRGFGKTKPVADNSTTYTSPLSTQSASMLR